MERAERDGGRRRGGAVCPFCLRRGATVPGTLGRRLLCQLRIDGRKSARRAVDWPVRLRVLEPRYRRVRKHRSGARLQALVRVRTVLQPQPPARQQILPRAVGVR